VPQKLVATALPRVRVVPRPALSSLVQNSARVHVAERISLTATLIRASDKQATSYLLTRVTMAIVERVTANIAICDMFIFSGILSSAMHTTSHTI